MSAVPPAVPAVIPRRARLRMGVGAAVVLLLVGLTAAIGMAALAPKGQTRTIVPDESTVPDSAGATTNSILVHVLGAVATQGLYQLDDGARAVDAVAAAGGFLETADQSQLNLARLVSDGEQIYVPHQGEVPPAGLVAGKVNVNTADAATLDTLPRVGPAMAERIIQWRDANGRFSAIEDLMNVSGIGDKTFDGLKSLITV